MLATSSCDEVVSHTYISFVIFRNVIYNVTSPIAVCALAESADDSNGQNHCGRSWVCVLSPLLSGP